MHNAVYKTCIKFAIKVKFKWATRILFHCRYILKLFKRSYAYFYCRPLSSATRQQ